MSFVIDGIAERAPFNQHQHDLATANYCMWHSWLNVEQLLRIIPALEDYGYDHGDEFEPMLEALRDAAGRLCDAVFDGMPRKNLFEDVAVPDRPWNANLGTAPDVLLRMILDEGRDSYVAGITQKKILLDVGILIGDFEQLDALTDMLNVADWAKSWCAHIRRLAYQLENVR